MSNNYKIICSRFNEDIRWILPFIQNTIIINKGNDDLQYIPQNNIIKYLNEGREGGTYLKFIIDNYENLPDYILFIQGNPFDHIHGNDNKQRGIEEIIDILFKIYERICLPDIVELDNFLCTLNLNER